VSPPVAVAVIYTCLSLIYFFWIGWEGSKRISSYDDFFLSGRSVSGRSFQYTLVSGTTSFATVLLYFITASEAYGIFFAANLVIFLLGQYFFFYVATKSSADLSKFSTLSKFVLEETGSKTISRWVNLITVLGFVGVLFLELLVGSTVFSYVIPGEYSELIGFGVISVLIMSYISIGGFAAVVESDSWQYQLIILACAVILIFVFFVMPFKTGDFSLGRAVSWSVSVDVWLTLLLQATVVNFTLPFCQLSSWERVASTGEWETVRNNYAPALIKIGLIWAIFIVFGLSLNGVGEASSDIGGVFSYVVSASNLSAYIIFPVLFGGG
jgi:Na+/proline symporter